MWRRSITARRRSITARRRSITARRGFTVQRRNELLIRPDTRSTSFYHRFNFSVCESDFLFWRTDSHSQLIGAQDRPHVNLSDIWRCSSQAVVTLQEETSSHLLSEQVVLSVRWRFSTESVRTGAMSSLSARLTLRRHRKRLRSTNGGKSLNWTDGRVLQGGWRVAAGSIFTVAAAAAAAPPPPPAPPPPVSLCTVEAAGRRRRPQCWRWWGWWWWWRWCRRLLHPLRAERLRAVVVVLIAGEPVDGVIRVRGRHGGVRLTRQETSRAWHTNTAAGQRFWSIQHHQNRTVCNQYQTLFTTTKQLKISISVSV